MIIPGGGWQSQILCVGLGCKNKSNEQIAIVSPFKESAQQLERHVSNLAKDPIKIQRSVDLVHSTMEELGRFEWKLIAMVNKLDVSQRGSGRTYEGCSSALSKLQRNAYFCSE